MRIPWTKRRIRMRTVMAWRIERKTRNLTLRFVRFCYLHLPSSRSHWLCSKTTALRWGFEFEGFGGGPEPPVGIGIQSVYFGIGFVSVGGGSIINETSKITKPRNWTTKPKHCRGY